MNKCLFRERSTQSPSKPEKQEREKRLELVDRLEKAEKQHDFYTKLYRTYSADLLKMSLCLQGHHHS